MIQLEQPLDAVCIDTLTPLAIHVLLLVTRQRSHHHDLVVSKKFWQVLITRLHQNGWIAAIHDGNTQCPRGRHQRLKVWVHLRRATSHIQDLNIPLGKESQNQLHGIKTHQLCSSWPGIDMTMRTAEVAQVAKIDL